MTSMQSQGEFKNEMDKLIKKKDILEIEQEKLNLQVQQFKMYKRKMARDLNELQNLRKFKRKTIESGYFPDSVAPGDSGVNILQSHHDLTHIMEESRNNEKTRGHLAADISTFVNEKEEFQNKLSKFEKAAHEFEIVQKNHNAQASQLEKDKKAHKENLESKTEFLDDCLKTEAEYDYTMSTIADKKNEVDRAHEILKSERAQHERDHSDLHDQKLNFEEQLADHKLYREAFNADQAEDQKLREVIKKEHDEREKRHEEREKKHGEQLQHIQNKHNDHQDKCDNLNQEQESFKEEQKVFYKLQMEQSKNIKLYQNDLAKLYEKMDQLDHEKGEHMNKVEASTQIYAKAKKHVELEKQIAGKKKTLQQLDVKRAQHILETRKLKEDRETLEKQQTAFATKQLQFDKQMEMLNTEIDKQERHVKNYHKAKKDLIEQESAHTIGRELLDAKNEDLQKQIDRHEIDKLTFEEQKEKLLELVEKHRLDDAELKKSQEEVAHLTSIWNHEKYSSEKDLTQRRKNIHEDKMHDERMLIIEQKNKHLTKLTAHDKLERNLAEEKMNFKKQLEQFKAEKLNQEKEREEFKKKAEDLQYREKRLQIDQRSHENLRKLSQPSLGIVPNEMSQTDEPNIFYPLTNTISQSSKINEINQDVAPWDETSFQNSTESKHLHHEEMIRDLKNEKSELLETLSHVKNKHAIEQYNFTKEKKQHEDNLTQHKKNVDQLVKSQQAHDSHCEHTQEEFDILKALLYKERESRKDEKEHLALDQMMLIKNTELLAQKEENLNLRIEEYEQLKTNIVNGLERHKLNNLP